MTTTTARRAEVAYPIALALLAAMAAGSLLVLAYGESPARVYRVMLARTWGDTYGIGQVLFRATLLTFTGLSVAIAFHAGLFNIGAEGQLLVGSFACGVIGASLPASTPAALAIPLTVLAAATAGGLLGALPGWLKARFGAHEVINTIMLNFISGALVLWAARRFFFEPQSVHTRHVIPGAVLPSLGLSQSAASWAFLLAVGCAIAVHLYLTKTKGGFDLRAFGKNPLAAEAGGVSASRTIVVAMTLAGALSGLVGAATVLGYKGFYEDKQGAGAGFLGIAVALLARQSALGVVIAALVFGTLAEGSLFASALVPKEIIDTLQAVIILTIAVTTVRRPRS